MCPEPSAGPLLPLRRLAPAIPLALAALLAGACASMEAVDRRIERQLETRSRAMGAPPPDRRSVETVDTSTVDPYDASPATRNPPAGELAFDPADPNRDVLERLESFYEPGDERVVLDLEEAFRIAQRSAREYRTAEEDYVFAAIRYLIERHRWGPRLFNDTTALTTFDADDGDYSVALNVINELRVTQRLPYGGAVEARWVTAATHQLAEIVGTRTERSSELILSADIPLLRDAGMIAREDILQAERELVYAARDFERFRREFLVAIARDYFDLVAQQDNIANQEQRLRSVIALKEQREALVQAGRRAPFEARNVQQNVARSQATLSNSQDRYQLAKDRFKVRLGLPVDVDLVIRPVTLVLPEPSISVSLAAQLALSLRLDFQTAVDRIGDFKRAVENAKNQTLPDLDVAASARFSNEDEPGIGGDLAPAYDLEDTDYSLGVTFGLPLDREIERLTLRQATINLARAERNLTQTRDILIVEARAAVREIERARFALQLQEAAIDINQERLRQLEIDAAAVDAQIQLDAENELLQSRNDRDAALRDLRVAILNYLLVTGQMRVEPDGTFQPPAGMVVRRAPSPDAPDLGPGAAEPLLEERPGPGPEEGAPGQVPDEVSEPGQG